tara:strand:+ start:344 stop:733 length:390 start_codon:yes stop_codon:yes gene_type:complete
MSTTYSYSISNCYRDNTNIVDEIFVKWTASKTDTGVYYNTTLKNVVVLDPPGSSPISWADLNETTLRTWYENKIKEKETVYNAANPSGVADTMTIEERVKDQLDNLLESKIYNAKLELSAPSNISGLPY